MHNSGAKIVRRLRPGYCLSQTRPSVSGSGIPRITSIRSANFTSGPPSHKPDKPSRRPRSADLAQVRTSSIFFETPERWCKTRTLVKIHPFAPVSIYVAGHCYIRGGHHVDPARTPNIFARVLKRKQGQRLQLLRAHSHVFPAARPRNAKSITQSASLQPHPQSLMGFVDNSFIGQSLTFLASVFFYIWSINWTTCPSCGKARQCVSRLHASPVHAPI